MEDLIRILSDLGLKETRDIAHHTDSIDEFISIMKFDIDERTEALKIAKGLSKKNRNGR